MLPRARALFALLPWLSILFSLAAAQPNPPATRPVDFSGHWQTTYGPMTLAQRGDAITGAYGPPDQQSTLTGKLANRRFTFTYAEPAAKGEGWFDLSPDGRSFQGQWREQGQQLWGGWTGRRAAAGPALVARGPFNGLWQTDYGRMRLWQSADSKTVRGIYELGGRSTISGELQADGKTLKLRYDQPDGEKGEATYKLSDDGKSFAGTWKPSAGPNGARPGPGGQWNGTRILPKPGQVWLVILEAHWEHGLAENEYSFGEMLRTFFKRVPTVNVRHRFFHDEADLRRFVAEVTYLAEPVVLEISSHGTAEAVTVGPHKITAKALAEILRDAGDLRLLHFGTCLICSGDIPKQIHESVRSAGGNPFPISGYRNTADWGGSAVVDFTYLDLVLSRGMPPALAADHVKKMLTFANDRSNPADPIPGAGLTVIEPPEPLEAAAK